MRCCVTAVPPAADADRSKAHHSAVLLPLQPLLRGHGLHHHHHPQHAVRLPHQYLNHVCPGLLPPDVFLHSAVCHGPRHSHRHGVRPLHGHLQPSALQRHHDPARPAASRCRSLGVWCSLHSSCHRDGRCEAVLRPERGETRLVRSLFCAAARVRRHRSGRHRVSVLCNGGAAEHRRPHPLLLRHDWCFHIQDECRSEAEGVRDVCRPPDCGVHLLYCRLLCIHFLPSGKLFTRGTSFTLLCVSGSGTNVFSDPSFPSVWLEKWGSSLLQCFCFKSQN